MRRRLILAGVLPPVLSAPKYSGSNSSASPTLCSSPRAPPPPHPPSPPQDVSYQRVRPTQKLQPTAGPFQDATENKASFQNWGTQPVTRAGPATRGNLAAIGPFDGTTTYRTDYLKLNGGARAPVTRPTSGHRALRGKGPFEGVSMYTTDYVPKPFDPVTSYKPCEGYDEDC